MSEESKAISRQIGWMNANSGLQIPISCSNVLDKMVQVGELQSLKILNDLQRKAESVGDPTNYILAACKRTDWSGSAAWGSTGGYDDWNAGGSGGNAQAKSAVGDWSGKIGKQVGWLNKQGQLAEKISYNDVVGALSELDVTKAMKILKDVHEGAATINSPTNYIIKAAQNASARTDSRWQSSGASEKDWRKPADAEEEQDDGKRISKQIGYLNNNVLYSSVNYAEVKDMLEDIDVTAAMKILKDLEKKAHSIENPTSYVKASCKRAKDARCESVVTALMTDTVTL